LKTKKKRAIFNWSGGKDSSLCLHRLLLSGDYEISYLLTTVSEKYQRISQHGVRVDLLETQAQRIGIALHILSMPDTPTMEAYNSVMERTLQGFKDIGITLSIFGDIFLEDLRTYREERLASIGFKGVFPLWKIPTKQLADEFIDLGFKAVIVCIDERHLDKSYVGREFDNQFLDDLPENVDPCGEHGEFHSFVYDGPIFSKPVEFKKGKVVYRKYTPPKSVDIDDPCAANTVNPQHITTGFWYCDLLPD